MGQTKKKQNANSKQAAQKSDDTRRTMGAGAEVEVLYQRMGDKWFAFSIVDDEVFVGEVPEEAIQKKAPSA